MASSPVPVPVPAPPSAPSAADSDSHHATNAASSPHASSLPASPPASHIGTISPLRYLPPHRSCEDDESTVVFPADQTGKDSNITFVDLYQQDYQQSRCRSYYYKWINPWIRWLLIIVILYVYALSSGVLTYRNNEFQNEMQVLLAGKGDPASTHPETEDSNISPLTGQIYVPFILRDLWYDFIPALQGNQRINARGFADASPIIFNIVMLLMLFLRRDVIRFCEYISIQMIMFSVNALVHVSTTYPDAGGLQAPCHDPEYQHGGTWMWWMIKTQYCGDMLWSGHTANTLVPIIIIRRLMWDFVGWNLSWNYTDSQTKQDMNMNMMDKHPWLFTNWNNDQQRNELFLQYIQNNNTEQQQQQQQTQAQTQTQIQGQAGRDPAESIQPLSPAIGLAFDEQKRAADQTQQQHEILTSNLVNYSPRYASNVMFTQGTTPLAAQSAANLSGNTNTLTEVTDEIALHPHENYDIHINVHAATTLSPTQQPNVDHDMFFVVYKSPYRTPDIVERHRKKFWFLVTFVRLLLLIWFPALLVVLLLVRFHYSDDVIVACFVGMLVCTNTHLLQWWVRMIYRPYYHNYVYSAWWKPVYLQWPLNEEQVCFEERIRRVGIGGIL